MKRARAAFTICLVVLAGCAGGPPVPEWRTEGSAALDNFQRLYLRGDAREADGAYVRARRELSATGDPALVARAQLFRCGIVVASLDFAACSELEDLEQSQEAEISAYARFLSGRWQGLEPAALPIRYRSVVEAPDAAARLAALKHVDPAVSRLVAASALYRAGRLPPGGADVAIDAASAEGYRRPLLAWLTLEEQRATAAGDAAKADWTRRRIETATDR
ncbi:MAG: hypothetical protein GC151_05545 [Betaproteobacteria bacterium]|nr:hypothetical protein [Betaproteobacteria bacterium]